MPQENLRKNLQIFLENRENYKIQKNKSKVIFYHEKMLKLQQNTLKNSREQKKKLKQIIVELKERLNKLLTKTPEVSWLYQQVLYALAFVIAKEAILMQSDNQFRRNLLLQDVAFYLKKFLKGPHNPWPQALYFYGLVLKIIQEHSEASRIWQRLINQQPHTIFAAYAYLLLGDDKFIDGETREAYENHNKSMHILVKQSASRSDLLKIIYRLCWDSFYLDDFEKFFNYSNKFFLIYSDLPQNNQEKIMKSDILLLFSQLISEKFSYQNLLPLKNYQQSKWVDDIIESVWKNLSKNKKTKQNQLKFIQFIKKNFSKSFLLPRFVFREAKQYKTSIYPENYTHSLENYLIITNPESLWSLVHKNRRQSIEVRRRKITEELAEIFYKIALENRDKITSQKAIIFIKKRLNQDRTLFQQLYLYQRLAECYLLQDNFLRAYKEFSKLLGQGNFQSMRKIHYKLLLSLKGLIDKGYKENPDSSKIYIQEFQERLQQYYQVYGADTDYFQTALMFTDSLKTMDKKTKLLLAYHSLIEKKLTIKQKIIIFNLIINIYLKNKKYHSLFENISTWLLTQSIPKQNREYYLNLLFQTTQYILKSYEHSRDYYKYIKIIKKTKNIFKNNKHLSFIFYKLLKLSIYIKNWKMAFYSYNEFNKIKQKFYRKNMLYLGGKLQARFFDLDKASEHFYEFFEGYPLDKRSEEVLASLLHFAKIEKNNRLLASIYQLLAKRSHKKSDRIGYEQKSIHYAIEAGEDGTAKKLVKQRSHRNLTREDRIKNLQFAIILEENPKSGAILVQKLRSQLRKLKQTFSSEEKQKIREKSEWIIAKFYNKVANNLSGYSENKLYFIKKSIQCFAKLLKSRYADNLIQARFYLADLSEKLRHQHLSSSVSSRQDETLKTFAKHYYMRNYLDFYFSRPINKWSPILLESLLRIYPNLTKSHQIDLSYYYLKTTPPSLPIGENLF